MVCARLRKWKREEQHHGDDCEEPGVPYDLL